MSLRKVRFLNLDFTSASSSSDLFDNLILNPCRVHFAAVSTVDSTFRDSELQSILSTGITLVDSTPLLIFLKRIDPDFKALRGTDFFRFALRHGSRPINHFVIGSTIENYNALKSIMSAGDNKNLLVGHISPPFGEDFLVSTEMVERIKKAKPDLIWICLGSPKQDYAAYLLHNELQISLVCVGAAIDFITGRIPEAPRMLHYSGFEWIFRLIVEPKRLWKRYLFGNFNFLMKALMSYFQR